MILVYVVSFDLTSGQCGRLVADRLRRGVRHSGDGPTRLDQAVPVCGSRGGGSVCPQGPGIGGSSPVGLSSSGKWSFNLVFLVKRVVRRISSHMGMYLRRPSMCIAHDETVAGMLGHIYGGGVARRWARSLAERADYSRDNIFSPLVAIATPSAGVGFEGGESLGRGPLRHGSSIAVPPTVARGSRDSDLLGGLSAEFVMQACAEELAWLCRMNNDEKLNMPQARTETGQPPVMRWMDTSKGSLTLAGSRIEGEDAGEDCF